MPWKRIRDTVVGGGLGWLVGGPVGGTIGGLMGASGSRREPKPPPYPAGGWESYAPEPFQFAFPSAPPPRDIGEEVRATLRAQLEMAPEIYAAERQFRPQYAALDWDIAQRYQPLYARLGFDLAGEQRGRDIGDVERLGPRAMEAAFQADPRQAALIDILNRQAMQELGADGRIMPDEERMLTQQSRAAHADRGMAMSNRAIFDELANNTAYRRALQDRARGFGMNMLNANQMVGGDVYERVLGRPSSTMGVAATTGRDGPSLFDPFNQYAGNLFSGNQAAASSIYGQNLSAGLQGGLAGYNAQNSWQNALFNAGEARHIAQMNADAARYGAGVQGITSIAGPILSALITRGA